MNDCYVHFAPFLLKEQLNKAYVNGSKLFIPYVILYLINMLNVLRIFFDKKGKDLLFIFFCWDQWVLVALYYFL